MKTVPVREAPGMVLCHDITQIIPGQFKGPAFRKGHIVQPEDIGRLLEMGKEHLYVWEMREDLLHEDAAAVRMAQAAAGNGIILAEPKEGKVELRAGMDGLLKIRTDALEEINSDEEVILATLHSNRMVCKGKILAGARIIPLVIPKKKIERVEEICRRNSPLMEVKPVTPLSAGIVTTGSEIYHGRIEDRFGPVIMRKLGEYGCRVLGQTFASDDVRRIADGILDFLHQGAGLITVTGGMSVDPDDVTPAAIRAAGGRVVTYGVPVLPGAMFMLAYIGDVPVMGLPGCVMYHTTSIFDLALPRVLAGEMLTRRDFARLAHGGLCIGCKECRYPDCSFGKGS